MPNLECSLDAPASIFENDHKKSYLVDNAMYIVPLPYQLSSSGNALALLYP